MVKPNKLRICIDPKDLNRAIKRRHYPLSTIEEVATKLSKAKMFSVLDAKSGFWEVPLSQKFLLFIFTLFLFLACRYLVGFFFHYLKLVRSIVNYF